MSEAREGTPEEIGRLLGAARDSQQEPTQQEQGEEQQQGDPEFNMFGSSEPSELLKKIHPPSEPEQSEAESEPEQPKDDPSTPTEADRTEAAKLLGMHPDLAPLLKGKTIEELVSDAAELAKTLEDLRRKREAEQAKPVSFDGGVRETMPAPSDPIAEHNQFLLDLFGKPGGTGGW